MAAQRDATDSQLLEMGADALFVEFVRLRDLGQAERAGLCIQLFAWRMTDEFRIKALLKLPQESVDEVVSATLESVIRATRDGRVPFDGQAIEQLYKWMYTVLNRRIAEFYRRRERQSRNAVEVSLDSGDEMEDGVAAILGENDAGYLAIELEEIRNSLIEQLRADHRQVISMTYDGYSAEDVAQVTGLSVANVHKIKSRYSQAREAAHREAGFTEGGQRPAGGDDSTLGDAA